MIVVHLHNKKELLQPPKKFIFKQNKIQIGKHSHNHIQINHDKVQAFQCELINQDNTWWVTNLNQKISVFLNGRSLQNKTQIQFQDRLEFLDYQVTLSIPHIKEIPPEYGKIGCFISDTSVSEIMLNGTTGVYIEQNGKLSKTEVQFESQDEILNLVQKLLAFSGRRLDEASPFVDARLASNMRLHAIISPLSLQGPVITIRKFLPHLFEGKDLIDKKTVAPDILSFLISLIKEKKNILISGATASGKTTLLNILSSYIEDHERIITIEDAAELQIKKPHVISLEARPPNIEDKGKISIRKLLQNALRMRPDRIIIGECRGEETLDMLQAMNTGHDGSLSTLHANSPRDALKRLEMLMLMSGCHFTVGAMRQQIESALDYIVHIARYPSGERKITHITQICGLEGETITLHDVFSWNGKDWTKLHP